MSIYNACTCALELVLLNEINNMISEILIALSENSWTCNDDAVCVYVKLIG